MTKVEGRYDKIGDDDGHTARLEKRVRDIGAKALIEECGRLSDSIADLRESLTALRRTTEIISALLEFPLTKQNALRTPFLDEVVVTASMFCNAADGFHGLEIQSNGTAYRWTGPTPEFRFVVYVDRRRNCRAELKLLNTELAHGVSCYVDRVRTRHELINRDDSRFVYLVFDIPKIDIDRGTELLFVNPSMVVPREMYPDKIDGRSLGVGFVELRVESLDGDVSENGVNHVEHCSVE